MTPSDTTKQPSRLAPMLSSATNEWETPQAFYDKLDSEFHFTLDPCATDENHKALKWFTEGDDGLSQPWFGSVFMNPPYGREIGKWMAGNIESGVYVDLETAQKAILSAHTKSVQAAVREARQDMLATACAEILNGMHFKDNAKDKWFTFGEVKNVIDQAFMALESDHESILKPDLVNIDEKIDTKCPTCGGSGGVPEPPFVTRDMHPYGGQVMCPVCHGTGRKSDE